MEEPGLPEVHKAEGRPSQLSPAPRLSPPGIEAFGLREAFGVMRGAKPAGGARCNFDIYVTVIVELFK